MKFNIYDRVEVTTPDGIERTGLVIEADTGCLLVEFDSMPAGTLHDINLGTNTVKKIGEKKMLPDEAAKRIASRMKNAEAQLFDAFAVMDLMVKDHKEDVDYYGQEANSYFNGLSDCLQRVVDALEKASRKETK